MNKEETIPEAPVILAARRISIQDRYSMERLRDLTLEIRRGEVVALIGSSEPAKRLLLRCLDMLDEPEGGNIEMNGEPAALTAHAEASGWRFRANPCSRTCL